MSNYAKLYWLTRLDEIQGLFLAFATIAGIVSLVIIIWTGINADMDDYAKKDEIPERKRFRASIRKKIKWLIPLCLFFSIITALCPTKNDVILIYAGGKAMDFAASDTSLSKIPYQTTAIITEYLDKTLKEMKEK